MSAIPVDGWSMETNRAARKVAGSQLPANMRSDEFLQDHLQKTEICKFFMKGRCTRGQACTYAHGHGELRQKPDFYCTRLCAEWFAQGRCSVGTSCRYAHSDRELRGWGREEFEEDYAMGLRSSAGPFPAAGPGAGGGGKMCAAAAAGFLKPGREEMPAYISNDTEYTCDSGWDELSARLVDGGRGWAEQRREASLPNAPSQQPWAKLLLGGLKEGSHTDDLFLRGAGEAFAIDSLFAQELPSRGAQWTKFGVNDGIEKAFDGPDTGCGAPGPYSEPYPSPPLPVFKRSGRPVLSSTHQ